MSNILQAPSIVKAGRLHAGAYSSLAKHYHPSTEIILITKGIAHLEIDGRHSYAKENDLIIYPAGQRHFDEFINTTSEVENYFIRVMGLQVRDVPRDHVLPEQVSPVLPTGRYAEELLMLF